MPRAFVAVGVGVREDGGTVLGGSLFWDGRVLLVRRKKWIRVGRAMVAALIEGRIESERLTRGKSRTLRRPRVFQGSF